MVSNYDSDTLRRARELVRRRQAQTSAPTTPSRFGQVGDDGTVVPEPSGESRFGFLGDVADFARDRVPQGVRDVAGTVAQDILSGEEFLNVPGLQLGTGIREALESVPEVPVLGDLPGRALGTAFDVAASPLTIATAGLGPGATAALRGAGPAGRLGAALMAPVVEAPSLPTRAFYETVLGTGGAMASEEAARRGAPAPLTLVAGAVGGLSALGATRAVSGAVRSGITRQSAQIAGNSLGATDNRTFVRDPRDFDAWQEEIRATTRNELEETGVGRAVNELVDPSKNIEGDLGVAQNAYIRASRSGDQLAEVAALSAVDSHARGAGIAAGRGGQVWNIADDGTVLNIRARDGQRSTNWYDIMSTPDAPSRYFMTDQQAALYRDIRQALDEIQDLRRSKGLPTFDPKDVLDTEYMPRIVRGIREAEIKGRTNQFLERVYETAAEGQAAGVRYENNPGDVLRLIAQATYREAALADFDAAIAPLLVSPGTAAARRFPETIQELRNASDKLNAARKALRNERSGVIRARAEIDKVAGQQTRKLGAARERLGKIIGELRGREHLQQSLPDADATLFRAYDRYEQAYRAADELAQTITDEASDLKAFESARRELATAERQLSRVMGEISERGRARGLKQSTGEPLLIARREQQTRLAALQKRVENAQNLVDDTRPNTGARRSAERRLARAREAVARLEGRMQAERSVSARLGRNPTSLGRRLQEAQAAVEEIRQGLDGLAEARKNLPRVRTRQGAAITDATADALDTAKKELRAVQAKWRRQLNSTKKSEVLPEYVFGRSNSTQQVRVATWKGKFLQEDADYLKLADELRRMEGRVGRPDIDPFTNSLQAISSRIRFYSAIGDLAMPFIQGLPLLGRNPVLWGKMAARHYRAFWDPSSHSKYLRDNLETVQEMARAGIPIGDVEQLIASGTARELRFVSGTRAGRQTIGRLEAAYDAGLTSSRVELWKALKPAWDGSDDDLARYIRNMTGGLDSAALGVGPRQRAIESVWLGFSPRLMRSTLALTAMAANPTTAAGREAARSLLGLAAGATALFVTANVGIGIANGESREEIEKRIEDSLNPLGGRRFLALDINGQHIGVGGQVRAISQFVAKSIANPSGFATADQFDNPLINWYMSRGAVGVNIAGAAAEGLSGERINALPFESIDSIPDAFLHLGKSTAPFVVQAQFDAEDVSLFDRLQMGLVEFGGVRLTEQTPREKIDIVAKQEYGAPYGELTGVQQQQLETEHADLFALRDRLDSEFGDREEKQREQTLTQIDNKRLNAERGLVDAFQRNQLTASQFREEMRAVQRIAAEQKRLIRGEFDYNTTDENKLALTAWYELFDKAKVPGTDIVDWDAYELMEQDLLATFTAEQRQFVEERRQTEHAPEAQWYFDNERLIRESGYWDETDTAFRQIQNSLPGAIASYSQLVLAIQQATMSGDRATAARLTRFKSRIDSIARRQREQLRRRSPELELALFQNGRVTTLNPATARLLQRGGDAPSQ